MKTLENIPMLSVTEIKKSPMVGFERAAKEGTGAYITNRDKVVGVMLTREQYEELVHQLGDARAKTERSVR